MSTARRSGAPALTSFAAAEVARAMNTTSTGPNGGFLLSTELAAFVWDKARAVDGPLARCLYLRTTRNAFRLPAFDESSRADGSRLGGVKHLWEGDDDASLSPAEGQPSLADMEFRPERVVVYSRVSNDLLEDADMLEDVLSYACTQEIRYAVVNAMINGDGVKRPLGVVNAPSTITVSRAGANAVAVADIDNMWSRLWGFCRRNAVWLASDDTLLKIDAVAATGGWLSNIYLPQGVAGNPFPLLKGRPLIPCEQCPALGQPGDLILGDWSQYGLVVRSLDGSPEIGMGYGLPIEPSMSGHRYFDTDESAFRWKLRVDGKPLWKRPVTIADGAQTAGPFCILSVGS